MVDRPETKPAFPDDLRGKRVIVLGAGRSGRAAAALLARHDARILLADDNAASVSPSDLEGIVASHVELVLGDVEAGLVNSAEAVVVSPGVPPTHPLLERAHECDVPVIGELELGSRYAQAPMIAVTGTNGKTTTVRWIAHLLAKEGRSALVCGNVGTALCEVVAERPDWFVVEVSSFQLEAIDRFHPRAAVVLNLAADHLDRHPTPKDYLRTKARITRNQDVDDSLVLNAEDQAVWSLAGSTGAGVWGFSVSRSSVRGFCCQGEQIVVQSDLGADPREVLARNELALPGSHNLSNALAAATAVWSRGLDVESIAEGLRDFPGVEHRLERVRKLRGVAYINDSKATNIASLEVALRSFDAPIVLIAGGRGKGASYESLASLVAARVRHLIVLGEEAGRIADAWGDRVETSRVEGMEAAVECAARLARPGDVVLLSPACASFDMYRDFEERGGHFKDLVMRQEE